MLNTKLIAEIGLNHGGSLKRAKKLVNLAKSSNVWGVKFQYFTLNNLINLENYKTLLNLDNNFEHSINQLLLSNEEFVNLLLYTFELNIPSGISFFSKEDLETLKNYFYLKTEIDIFKKLSFLKVASGEITDIPLLKSYSNILYKYGLEIIISTGVSTNEEINEALSILDPESKFKNKITLLHCKVEYPQKFEISNLKRIKELKTIFGYKTGLSDHSMGIEIPLLSLQFEPDVIEKHFTDNNKLEFADNPMSTESQDFKIISFIINNYSKIIGNGEPFLTGKEKNERKFARKGIYAKKNINIGDDFGFNNLITQRPNLEFNDSKYFNILLQKKSKNRYKKGDPIVVSNEVKR